MKKMEKPEQEIYRYGEFISTFDRSTEGLGEDSNVGHVDLTGTGGGTNSQLTTKNTGN